MHILFLGLDHQAAPVEIRERLALSGSALPAALARFGCGHASRPDGLAELVILSTCNRLELYAIAETDDSANLCAFLSEVSGQPWREFAPYARQAADLAAALHLCRVAAGLESMILGEPQILGQVAEAHALARQHGACGPVLSALFQAALRSGKRARTDTDISHHPASASSVAVALAAAIIPQLAAAHALVLGAGEMAELALEALRARGVRQVTVVNRTLERAAPLAEKWGGRALAFEQLEPALAQADIVIVSTGAPHYLVHPALARQALARRPERPLVFIDIAVPRNVDPAVGTVPNVHYYDIDDLQARLSENLAGRRRAVPAVEAIIDEELAALAAWLHSLDALPLIAQLRERAEDIRRHELERTLRALPDLDPRTRARIESLSEALVNKLLHEPTRRLRTEAQHGASAEYVSTVRYLFALDA